MPCCRFGPTMDQMMACCLTAPSHYLTQCCLLHTLKRGVQRDIIYVMIMTSDILYQVIIYQTHKRHNLLSAHGRHIRCLLCVF